MNVNRYSINSVTTMVVTNGCQDVVSVFPFLRILGIRVLIVVQPHNPPLMIGKKDQTGLSDVSKTP